MGRWTFSSLSPRQHCEKGVSGSGGEGAKYYNNCEDHDLSKILIMFCATKWESRILNSKFRLFPPLLDLLLKAGVLTTSEQSIWFWSTCQSWVNKYQEPSGIPLLSDLHTHKLIFFYIISFTIAPKNKAHIHLDKTNLPMWPLSLASPLSWLGPGSFSQSSLVLSSGSFYSTCIDAQDFPLIKINSLNGKSSFHQSSSACSSSLHIKLITKRMYILYL